jgi:hypothetical protein
MLVINCRIQNSLCLQFFVGKTLNFIEVVLFLVLLGHWARVEGADKCSYKRENFSKST